MRKPPVIRLDPTLSLCFAAQWCKEKCHFSRAEEKTAASSASWTDMSEQWEPACVQRFPKKALRGQCRATFGPDPNAPDQLVALNHVNLDQMG